MAERQRKELCTNIAILVDSTCYLFAHIIPVFTVLTRGTSASQYNSSEARYGFRKHEWLPHGCAIHVCCIASALIQCVLINVNPFEHNASTMVISHPFVRYAGVCWVLRPRVYLSAFWLQMLMPFSCASDAKSICLYTLTADFRYLWIQARIIAGAEQILPLWC